MHERDHPSISGLKSPVSSGFVIMRPGGALGQRRPQGVDACGRPSAAGYSVISRKPAVRAAAASPGCEKTVVMISSRWPCPRAACAARIIQAFANTAWVPPPGWNDARSMPEISQMIRSKRYMASRIPCDVSSSCERVEVRDLVGAHSGR